MLPLYYPYNTDMSIYGSLPSRDPIQLVVCKWCGRTVKDTAMLRHQGTICHALPDCTVPLWIPQNYIIHLQRILQYYLTR